MAKLSLPPGRLYRWLLVLFAIAAVRRVTYTIDAIRDVEHVYTASPVMLGSPWPTVIHVYGTAAEAGLRAGDRILTIDGRAPRGYGDVAAAFHSHRRGEEALVSAERAGQTMQLRVKPRVPEFGSNILSLLFAGISWIAMPWLSFCLGFWVAALRPRDPRAWIVLGILLGMGELTNANVLDPLGWRDVGMDAYLYHNFAIPVWAVCMLLFGVYFPQRWRFDRRAPGVKWMVIIPIAASSFWEIGHDLLLSIDFRDADRLMPDPAEIGAVLQTLLLIAPCFFFLGLSDKYRDQSLHADDRRRLRLLYWGCSAGLAPLFLLTLFTLTVHQRTPGDADNVPLVFAFMAMLLFPLTMAYVLVVQRAMDVRMVVRQGMQYALAQGGLRILQALAIIAVITVAANVANSHMSTPNRITAIALGVLVAVRIRPLGARLRLWLDRKFFREAYNAEQILGELSEQVRSILDAHELLDTVTRKISQSLHVDRIAVLLQDGGWYRPALSTGYAAPLDWALAADAPAVNQLRSSRAPVVVDEGAGNAKGMERLDAQLLLPLASKKELLGFISLGPKKSQEPYSPSDTSLLRTVAAQTGMALENSRLSEAIASEMAQRELLSREIEIAREVQQRLFPQTMPEVPALQYAGHCRPARGVGGDYYDFLALTGGSLGIAIGDVSGKGIPAALLMASLQASVRGQSQTRGGDVAGLMANVNRLVFDASQSNRYATFFYAQFDPATRKLIYTNGGHNPPLVLRGPDAMTLEVGGPPVGLFRESRYEQAEIQLEPGDLLVFFTDGISEAENGANDEWGEDALIATVRACGGAPPAEIITRIMRAADDFAAGAPQHDDMTLVVGRVL